MIRVVLGYFIYVREASLLIAPHGFVLQGLSSYPGQFVHLDIVMTSPRTPYTKFIPTKQGSLDWWNRKCSSGTLTPKPIEKTLQYAHLRGALDELGLLIIDLQQGMEILRTETTGTGSRGILPRLT